MTGIIIYGREADGTDLVEFKTAVGKSLAISIPRTEAAVTGHFQERTVVVDPKIPALAPAVLL